MNGNEDQLVSGEKEQVIQFDLFKNIKTKDKETLGILQKKHSFLLRSLNPHIVCMLCAGYLVNAATIVECLHTFCKSCIVKHIQIFRKCPTCGNSLPETEPLSGLRLDRTMQDIINKILPHIEKDEVTRGIEFHKQQQQQLSVEKEQAKKKEEPLYNFRDFPMFYRNDEQVNLFLKHSRVILLQTVFTKKKTTTSVEDWHYFNKLTNQFNCNNEQIKTSLKATFIYDTTQIKEGLHSHFSISNDEFSNGSEAGELSNPYVRCSFAVNLSHLKKMIKRQYEPNFVDHKVNVVCSNTVLKDDEILRMVFLKYWVKPQPMVLEFTFIPP